MLERDVFYVSNINGKSLEKDGNGFITRLNNDGTPETLRWIASGQNGVTLHAPKGMAVIGDTLWVSDIDVVRGLNIMTGRSIATIDLVPMGAAFLNDVATGPDGALYVTDTRVRADPRGNMSDAGTGGLHEIVGDRLVSLIEHLGDVADFEWDARRGRVAIPLTSQNRVEFYQIPLR